MCLLGAAFRRLFWVATQMATAACSSTLCVNVRVEILLCPNFMSKTWIDDVGEAADNASDSFG